MSGQPGHIAGDPVVSIRENPLKQCDLSYLPMDAPVPWNPLAHYLKQRPSFTLDPIFHSGAYYVQDASAMFTGWLFRQVLDRFGGRRVLDLCAAPGGKTTDAAASLRERYGDAFILVSNEVIRSRSSVLQDNVALWGDPNVVVSSSDPSGLGHLKNCFDIIIADVPCSGEGMFRKNRNAVDMWSEDNVALCAARQRRILADVWNALAPGGILVYSTCTFNDDENDGNVEWIAGHLGGEVLDFDMGFVGPVRTKYGFLMHPDAVRGEGQYCAAIKKQGNPRPAQVDDKTYGVSMFDRKGEIYAVPDYVAAQIGNIGRGVNVISAGVHAFSVKGRDRIPCADLALSALLDPDDFPSVELDKSTALHFLHRDALALNDAPEGFLVVKYCGLPLGFVKNIGKRCNNLHPASRRILMNVE